MNVDDKYVVGQNMTKKSRAKRKERVRLVIEREKGKLNGIVHFRSPLNQLYKILFSYIRIHKYVYWNSWYLVMIFRFFFFCYCSVLIWNVAKRRRQRAKTTLQIRFHVFLLMLFVVAVSVLRCIVVFCCVLLLLLLLILYANSFTSAKHTHQQWNDWDVWYHYGFQCEIK